MSSNGSSPAPGEPRVPDASGFSPPHGGPQAGLAAHGGAPMLRQQARNIIIFNRLMRSGYFGEKIQNDRTDNRQ